MERGGVQGIQLHQVNLHLWFSLMMKVYGVVGKMGATVFDNKEEKTQALLANHLAVNTAVEYVNCLSV